MTLEDHYRRLLRLYPRTHHRLYADEMLAVLLTDAHPTQSRPGVREVLDLTVSATAAHWHHGLLTMRHDDWRRAAHAVRFFGAILLLAVALRRVAIGPVTSLSLIGTGTLEWLARPALWAALLVALVADRRSLAVSLAFAGTVAELIPPAMLYLDTPGRLLEVWWIILTAFLVALATTISRPAAPPPAAAAPGTVATVLDRRSSALPRGTATVALAGVAIVGSAVAERLPGTGRIPLGLRGVPIAAVALLGVAAVLILAGVARHEPAVRRRVIAWAAPVAVALPLVRIGFAGFTAHNVRLLVPDLLGPMQWAALIGLPAAAFAFAAAAARRREGPRVPHPGGARFPADGGRISRGHE